MRINDAIKRLWKKGFFEKHRTSVKVKKELSNKFGMNPSNVFMNLKSCKSFLRKENKGWIQKIRYNIKNQSKERKINGLDLCDVTQDPRLIKACKTNYESKNYWDAVFNALRHMEVRVRSESGMSPSDYGADLMEKVFKPNVGTLKVPCCATPGEEDGFKHITKGMMMFHRNAKGHREELIDKNLALKIIGYVDYLLQIIETAEKRGS